ncbi:MAG TPA: NADH-quinone oxidoreductase subunit N [Longimicrobiales bacterium]|nr:NADH-quinone oxidoreductase subunit N [Longimicrobiales bacterium]
MPIVDLGNPWDYLWALLPEVVLSVWAMLLLLVDVFQKGDRSEPSHPAIAWLALVGVLLAGVANAFLAGSGISDPAGMIASDEFRIFANYLFLLAAALFILISDRYFRQEHMSLGELYVLVLFATVGMMFFAGATDLIVIFLGLEVMSVAVYVLTGLNRHDPRSGEGALKYFLLGAFSSAFFLFGIALVYGGTASTNLNRIALAIGADGLGANPMLLAGMALLITGFGFKIAAVPFHMWTPDAYEGAPAPITAFMAAGVKAAAFAAFLRVFLTAMPGLYESWGVIIAALAVITMVVANLIALTQDNVKRLLAYSSIAHAGYLLVALAAGNISGAAAFLFYLTAYTLMTIGAFAVVVAVGREGERHLDIESYAGLGWRRPWLAVSMTVFLLSLAGFPLTAGFIGKVYILRAALEGRLAWLAIVLVLSSLVSYYYYLRIAWYMWFRESADAEAAHGSIVVAMPMRVGLAIAAISMIVLFMLPDPLLDWAERGAVDLMQPASAVAASLPGG